MEKHIHKKITLILCLNVKLFMLMDKFCFNKWAVMKLSNDC